MTKQKSTPEYVTRETLKEEISASEGRLDAKIETTAQSLKDYTDSRFTQLDTKIETTAQSLKDYTDSRFTQLDGKIGDVDSKVKGLDTKMTKYFELMMQTFIKSDKETHKLFESYGERIGALEGRKSS